jgi:ribosome-binding factor A
VSVLGDETEREQAMEGLQSSRGVLQAMVGQELRMKRTPTLEFTYDESIVRGMRMEKLLSEHAPATEESER